MTLKSFVIVSFTCIVIKLKLKLQSNFLCHENKKFNLITAVISRQNCNKNEIKNKMVTLPLNVIKLRVGILLILTKDLFDLNQISFLFRLFLLFCLCQSKHIRHLRRGIHLSPRYIGISVTASLKSNRFRKSLNLRNLIA